MLELVYSCARNQKARPIATAEAIKTELILNANNVRKPYPMLSNLRSFPLTKKTSPISVNPYTIPETIRSIMPRV